MGVVEAAIVVADVVVFVVVTGCKLVVGIEEDGDVLGFEVVVVLLKHDGSSPLQNTHHIWNNWGGEFAWTNLVN